ncbi:MAG: hypothetical protein JNM11_02605, partial [Chitinimonas sp.]|nr:hypothetical protein [Chitinimonas sp.]
GQLSVNGGAATFSLPISLPPGTNGMVPSVSLNYSSQARNGIAGLGWGLSGFSAIHRCNKTLVQDGVVGAVRFDLEDRLCLDGQRLTLVSAGTNPANDQDYWREDAEYRTEIETYSRITRSNSGGKLGFKVESKSGQIMYYGDSDNSQVDAQGRVDQQANSWAIRRTQDRNGNLVDYRYSKDSTRGEHLPVEIRWGGNDAANQAHYAKVSFVFSAQDRPDTEVGYLSGSKVTRSKLLEAIQTYTDTDAAGNGGKAGVVYTLTYGTPSPTSGRSRLESIQACEGAQVGSTPKCLPATRFGWGQPAGDASPKLLITSTRNGPDLVTKGMTGGNKYHHINQSDFDGDGRDDLLSDNWNLYQSTAGNWIHRPLTPVGGNATLHATAMLLGDYDGDGVTDVAYPDNGNLMVCRSTLREGGSGFTCSNWGAVATDGKENPYMPADVDGDSRTDIVVRGSTGGKACISTGAGFTCKDWAQVSKVIPEPEQRPTMDEFPDPQADITPFSGDLNGDGLVDYVRVFPTGINANRAMEVQVCLTAKTGFDCSVWFSSTASSDVGAEVRQAARNGQLVQDLNGDGYADLLLMTDVKRLCYSTGKGFDCQLQAEILPMFGANHLTDVDADGQIDGMTSSYICRIWGTGNQCKNNADSQSPYGEQMVGDYDGDGRPDIAANSYTDRGQWQIASFANLA